MANFRALMSLMAELSALRSRISFSTADFRALMSSLMAEFVGSQKQDLFFDGGFQKLDVGGDLGFQNLNVFNGGSVSSELFIHDSGETLYHLERCTHEVE
jgi:hypothetical protein